MDEPFRFLSFVVMGTEIRSAWEDILRREGYPLDGLDLSDRACALLAMADAAVMHAPPWAAARIAEALRAPAKARKDPRRLARWMTAHWHQAGVRNAMDRHLTTWVLRQFQSAPVDREKVWEAIRDLRARHDGDPALWVHVLWSALNSPDPHALDAARDAWGPDGWDQSMAAFRDEVRPALWVLLVRPEIDRLIDQYRGERRIRELADQVRALSWEADRARDKHMRATDRLRDLSEEIGRLRQELAERDRRIREMEEAMAEERRLWAEMLDRAKAARTPARGGALPLPLAGKRVAVVGGDPIGPGAAALIESMGGEPVICPGFDRVSRVPDAVRTADVVAVVTAHMSHKHFEALKSALRDGQRVLWVNSSGLTALRRALADGLQRAG